LQLRDDHAADQPRERIKLVEPGAPKTRNLRLGDGDSAEEGEDDDEEGVEQAGDEAVRRDSGVHLAQRDGEEIDDEDHEELVSRAVGTGLEAWEAVQREKEANGAQEQIRRLSTDHGKAKANCRYALAAMS